MRRGCSLFNNIGDFDMDNIETKIQDLIRELLLLTGDITVLRNKLDVIEQKAEKLMEKIDEN